MSIWGSLISAGVSLAGDLLAQDTRDQQQQANRETTILQLQDNERGREAQADRLQAEIAAALERTQLNTQAQLDIAKKRILGDVLLKQGEGQEKLMLESYRAAEARPERFNDAASVLAQILSR